MGKNKEQTVRGSKQFLLVGGIVIRAPTRSKEISEGTQSLVWIGSPDLLAESCRKAELVQVDKTSSPALSELLTATLSSSQP